ncbi:glycoside hydrolase family 3 N-terminal domain-containing protein [Demequina lignilytica]|uniref:Glycoside hydrolase family 3 N-terminal domain-containing protein n=1 Tax=Demequina lignilytica TaxID=3051663 RepID=A0AB35MK61_9MICO|nr:glycoside hydrolase family 3 N-terminal domain-containing protein [Demequina sp. SYSU T0a273]MDN4484068.1 glycoside hydrolase family 3 N-terminal domain-containing protein [Demequina sp. SYSU T0a273]
MTLEEKLAQLVGFWEGEEGDSVAPLQGELSSTGGAGEAMRHGLGQITRAYGTNPVEPDERAAWLWERQRALVTGTRLGIPAIVHEECLTGLAAWKAATFPSPPAWGASFDDALVERMGALIGSSMAALGIHQGLAPVLDVVRDPRWGRTEEAISEDPLLVGSIGTAYVRGLQSAGVDATLKHFAGYSASAAGRNFAPVSMGPRELADTVLPPFEMAVKDGGARAVMHAYTAVDGVPSVADRRLLTVLLRDEWGFDGVVVADYFGVAFLHVLHDVAADLGEAASMALAAGVDVELPTGDAYLGPLAAAVRAGSVPEELVDRSVVRVLAQKERLGLLDRDFAGAPPGGVDLDSPEHRAVARALAEESIVLVSNDGTLPLSPASRVAVIGPNADRAQALFGCYSFVNHVLAQRPGVAMGIEAPTMAAALAARWEAPVTVARGCGVSDPDRSGFDAAVEAARGADVAVIAVGDHAGLFGRGTVGEGCDADSLELPGVQRALVEAVLETGTPVVLVALTGRPYALGWAMERCAAVVQAYFPGEEGGGALAAVLAGDVNPSGRLPITLPRSAGAQPYTYLHSRLGGATEVTHVDPTPAAEFGHGLSYTAFSHEELGVAGPAATDGWIEAEVSVVNTGARAGTEVVQLYGRDVRASLPRPVAQLLAYARVPLAPGESRIVRFRVPTSRLAFSGVDLARVVEPGEVELWTGTSERRRATATVDLVGPVHRLTGEEPRLPVVEVG